MGFHHLFMCSMEHQDCKPITTTSEKKVLKVKVPGYLSRTNRKAGHRGKVPRKQKVLIEEARVNADGLIKWITRLHREGKSLNGKFDASDLMSDPCGNIKCRETKQVLLKLATEKRKKKDFKRIGRIIRYDILDAQSDEELPHDVTLLLELLKSYQTGFEVLIENHPGIMTEDQKISLFGRLFSELESLMVIDPTRFGNIIGAMDKTYGYGAWKPFAYCNSHVYDVYTYKGRMWSYSDSAQGAIYLHRNCFQHLIKDHSTATTQGGQIIVLFVHKQMEHMLGTILPGLITSLLVELHKESALANVF